MDKPVEMPKGKHFERRVANLFVLLGYSVQVNVLIAGRQVDLRLEDRSGPISHMFIVECKNQATPVTTAQYDSFRGRLFAAKSEISPKLKGIIVSSVGFVKEAKAQSQHDEIELITITELETSVIDFRQYVRDLTVSLAEDPTLEHFVEPYVKREYLNRPESAYSLINEWLADPLSNQMTLLGDYGTGKSTLLKHLALTMARKYEQEVLEEGARGRLPLFVDLREYTHALSLKQIVLDLLDTNSIRVASYAAFEHISSEGQLLLILDGFDEMASRGNYQTTLRNFRELNKSAKGRAKIILSCRTHYFTTDRDVLKFHGEPTSNRLIPSYTDLYREIATRPNFVITYLQEFETYQVEQYLRSRCGDRWMELQAFIRKTYNLNELSRKPVLLDMIVSSEGRIETGERVITPGILYQVYTDIWLARNDWSLTIDVATKSELLERFALSASLNPEYQLDHRAIPRVIKLWKEDITEVDAVELDRELRTATFLVRDEGGNYKFSHKSFQEFFLAKHLLSEARRDRVYTWGEGFFRTEVYRFIRDLLQSMPDAIEALTRWLQDSQVSEFARANAAKCLGGLLDPKVVAALIDVLEKAENRIVRRSAATSLGSYSQADVVNALIRAASVDECRFVRSNCLVSLGKLNRPESNAFLLEAINGNNPWVPAGKWTRWPFYMGAKAFRNHELVKAAIREGPVASSRRNRSRSRAIEACLDLCKQYRWPESENYCINVLDATTSPKIAALAFSILPTDKKKAFVPKMLTLAQEYGKTTDIPENFIRALRGTVHEDIEDLLCSLLIGISFRKASVAFEILVSDYPAAVLRNAEHWMGAPHYSSTVRVLAATEFAKHNAPDGLGALTALLARTAKRAVLDLIYRYYPSQVSKVIQDAWTSVSLTGASLKRHALEILLSVDRDAAVTLMLDHGLYDPKIGIRVAVCAILAAERSDLVTNALIKVLGSDDSKWVRLQALQSLCSPGREVARSKIFAALEGEADPDVNSTSAQLLGIR